MKQVKNNENKMINVSIDTYNGLQQMYNNGYFSAIVKDINGNIHVVIIFDNF